MSLAISILIAIVFFGNMNFSDKYTALNYLYIGASFFVALFILMGCYYLLERRWNRDIYTFRLLIDERINVGNIINVITGLTTLFVFIVGTNNGNFILIFSVLAIVYTYYVFFNFIYIRNRH